MKTLAIVLASVLAQAALASECVQTGAWVLPAGVIAAIESADAGKGEPGKAGTSRETFITRIGQDNKGYWTMTKEAIHGVQVDEPYSTAYARSPRVAEVTPLPGAQ